MGNSKTAAILGVVVVLVLVAGFYWVYSNGSLPGFASTPTPQITLTPTTTPFPTPGAVSITSYTVDQEAIAVGGCIILSWEVENAEQIQLFRGGEMVLFQSEASDTFQDCPEAPGNVIYRLEASGESGGFESEQIRVSVAPPPTDTPLPTLAVTPGAQSAPTQATDPGPIRFVSYALYPDRIALGECVELSWQVENAAQVTLQRSGEVVLANAPLSGSARDCPEMEGRAVYRLEASNPDGTNNFLELQVLVEAGGAAPTAGGQGGSTGPVTIMFFTVDDGQISRGQCVTLSWDVRNADQVTLLRGGELLVENAQHASSFQECLSTQGQAIYRLEVRNSGGYFNYLELHVTVL